MYTPIGRIPGVLDLPVSVKRLLLLIPTTTYRTEDFVEAARKLDVDLVIAAPDGALAAFCWGGVDPAANASSGRNEGQVHLLGTRRGYRGLGLGRAILLAGLRALAAAGAESVWLSVDADSPTGATRLYESAGFSATLTRMLYGKELDV